MTRRPSRFPRTGASTALSLRQAQDAWQQGIKLVEYAKDHPELKGAFESFSAYADRLYPGWRDELGTGA